MAKEFTLQSVTIQEWQHDLEIGLKKIYARLYASWMYKERSFQIKSMIDTYACSIKFKYGKIISLEWIRKHYMTEIANKPLDKLMESGW